MLGEGHMKPLLSYRLLVGSKVSCVLSCTSIDIFTRLQRVGLDPKSTEMSSVKPERTQTKQNGRNVGKRLLGNVGGEGQ